MCSEIAKRNDKIYEQHTRLVCTWYYSFFLPMIAYCHFLPILFLPSPSRDCLPISSPSSPSPPPHPPPPHTHTHKHTVLYQNTKSLSETLKELYEDDWEGCEKQRDLMEVSSPFLLPFPHTLPSFPHTLPPFLPFLIPSSFLVPNVVTAPPINAKDSFFFWLCVYNVNPYNS